MTAFRARWLAQDEVGRLPEFFAAAARVNPLHVLGYHAPEHLSMLARHYRASLGVAALEADGVLAAVLPGLWVDLAELGWVWNGLPHFGPNAGLIFGRAASEQERKDAWRLALAFLDEEAVRRSAASWSLLGPIGERLTPEHVPSGMDVVLEERATLAQQLQTARPWGPRIRADLAKAERSGVQVEALRRGDREALLDIYFQTCAENGIPPKARSLLSELLDAAEAQQWCRATSARSGSELLGGLVVISSPSTLSYYLPAVHRQQRQTQAMAALVDEAFCWGLETGRTFWNWESSPAANPGVAAFKRRFGGEPIAYWRATRVLELERIRRVGAARIQEAFPNGYVVPWSMLAAGAR